MAEILQLPQMWKTKLIADVKKKNEVDLKFKTKHFQSTLCFTYCYTMTGVYYLIVASSVTNERRSSQSNFVE